jgi:hypothetical protein
MWQSQHLEHFEKVTGIEGIDNNAVPEQFAMIQNLGEKGMRLAVGWVAQYPPCPTFSRCASKVSGNQEPPSETGNTIRHAVLDMVEESLDALSRMHGDRPRSQRSMKRLKLDQVVNRVG